MNIRKVCVISALFIYPTFIGAMQMDPAAPSVEEDLHPCECFDKSLSAPCAHGYEGLKRLMGEHCAGLGLPMAVACQGCSYCSMQLLLCSLSLRSQCLPNMQNTRFEGACAISAASSACLAYAAHKLDSFQRRQKVASLEHAKCE